MDQCERDFRPFLFKSALHPPTKGQLLKIIEIVVYT